MQYIIKSGVLYKDKTDIILAKIRNSLIGPSKTIYGADEHPVYKADIVTKTSEERFDDDVRNKEYIVEDNNGNIIIIGRPAYAEGNDPKTDGWPVNRMPKVDHVSLTIDQDEYTLTMQNSTSYIMKNFAGEDIFRICHNGILGGWKIDDLLGFIPEINCGLFAFCRYIEQENEFLIV